MKEIQIGSERYFYKIHKDENRFSEEKECIFCDELDEYIFCLYTKKLNQTKSFIELKKQMQEMLIYLPDYNSKGYIDVPCLVVKEQKKIYMVDSIFNQYWIRISFEIGKQILQQDINSRVDLSYLETDTRFAYIGTNYQIEYKGRCIDIKKQHLASKKANALNNSRIYYIFSQSDGTLHDKTCEKVSMIKNDFMELEEIPKKYNLCSRCRRKVYIRNAIEVNKKFFLLYEKYLLKLKIRENKLKQFLWDGKIKLHIDQEIPNRLYIKCEEDNWYIQPLQDHTYELYHNNYRIAENGERVIYEGFHRQNFIYKSGEALFCYVENYDWQVHLKCRNNNF